MPTAELADAALAAGARGPAIGQRIHAARVQAVAQALADAAPPQASG